MQRTEKKPENPWYLPMRLQLDQLCSNIGKGRETLNERKKDFMEHPDEISLLRYLSMLDNRQEYEAILSIGEEEGPAREILFPPSEKNLSIWWQLIHAAAEMSNTDFIEQHLPPVLEVCDNKVEFDFLMCLLNVYRDEQLAAIKGRLRFLLPEVSLNQYFEEKVKERIEETVQIENLTKKEITC